MDEPPTTAPNEATGPGLTDINEAETGEIIPTPYYHVIEDNTSMLNMTAKSAKRPEESHTTPVFVFTAIFGLIFIIAPLLVRRGPNRSITRVCIMLATVCCWIFWTTTYIVQMNPLLGPRMSNHSLAWIGHKWGHDPASLTAAAMNETETTTEATDATIESLDSNTDSSYRRAVDDLNAKENADANELTVSTDGSDSTST